MIAPGYRIALPQIRRRDRSVPGPQEPQLTALPALRHHLMATFFDGFKLLASGPLKSLVRSSDHTD
jgi:hypothetical protein